MQTAKTTTCTVVDAIDDANGIVEGLAEEMTSWADNIEDKFAGTDKYERVREAADTLSGVTVPDVTALCDDAQALPVTYRVTGKRPSRHDRADEASSAYAASAEALRTFATAMRAHAVGKDAIEDSPWGMPCGDLDGVASDLDEVADACDEIAEEIGTVEFPGMYG